MIPSIFQQLNCYAAHNMARQSESAGATPRQRRINPSTGKGLSNKEAMAKNNNAILAALTTEWQTTLAICKASGVPSSSTFAVLNRLPDVECKVIIINNHPNKYWRRK